METELMSYITYLTFFQKGGYATKDEDISSVCLLWKILCTQQFYRFQRKKTKKKKKKKTAKTSKKKKKKKLPKLQIAVAMVTVTTMWFDFAFRLLPSNNT